MRIKFDIQIIALNIVFIMLFAVFFALKILNLYSIFALLTALAIILIVIGIDKKTVMLFYIVAILLMIRLYPYYDGLPLGVDPIRDVIYADNVIRRGHIIMNFPRQVRYYEYFPAIHLLSIITTFISGLPLETCHYTVNAIVFALSSLILIYAIKHSIGKRTFSPIMLYAFIPTIATWGYWIIPMMFAIIFVMFSIYAISKLSKKDKASLKLFCLCFLFIALPAMIHPVVGLLALAYIPFVILSVALINKKFSKPLVILLCISLVYTYAYWNQIGFTNQLSKTYVNICNKISQGTHLPSSLEKIFTRSLIVPPKVQTEETQKPITQPRETSETMPETAQPSNQSPQTTQETIGHTETPEHQEVLEEMTTLHGRIINSTNFLCLVTNTNLYTATLYNVLPRWIWAFLLIITPFIILVLHRRKLGITGLSSCTYGALLSISIIFFAYLQLIGKVERYIGSPATVFIIVAISTSLLLHGKLRKILCCFMLIMLISGLLDPRTSFYVNQFEGDRVTFNYSEKEVWRYTIYRYNSSKIITDYNLMTSLAWYYSNKYNVSLNIIFCPIKNAYKFLKQGDTILVVRRYSIFSAYIYILNYGDMNTLSKLSFYSLLVYSNGETVVFYR